MFVVIPSKNEMETIIFPPVSLKWNKINVPCSCKFTICKPGTASGAKAGTCCLVRFMLRSQCLCTVAVWDMLVLLDCVQKLGTADDAGQKEVVYTSVSAPAAAASLCIIPQSVCSQSDSVFGLPGVGCSEVSASVS